MRTIQDRRRLRGPWFAPIAIGWAAILCSCAHTPRTVIGDYARIGEYATIESGAKVGVHAEIEHHAIVRRGLSVGDYARVKARSVVTQDVPAYGVVEGDPAKLIGLRAPDGMMVWTAGPDQVLPPVGTVIPCPGGGELVVERGAVRHRDPEKELLAAARGFQDVHRYLLQYPAGHYVARAQAVLRDSAAVHHIKQEGEGDRFVIRENPSPSVEQQVVRNLARQTWGYCVMAEGVDGTLSMEALAGSMPTIVGATARPSGWGRMRTISKFEFPYLGDGSVVVIKDAVGSILDSASEDPLRFLLVYGTGLVYLGGRGRVLDEAGGEVFLGRE